MSPNDVLRGFGFAIPLVIFAPPALAQVVEADKPVVERPPRDTRDEIPILAYTYAAAGVDGPSVGAYGYFNFLAGSGLQATPANSAVPGGGVIAYGSPIDRLTIVADASRSTVNGSFAPSLAVLVRPIGHPSHGFSLGLMAKYKIESFGDKDAKGGDGDGDLEHEIENALLIGYAAEHWHFDVNSIVGFGLSDDHEVDIEGRIRVARDFGERVRLGIDGQVRGRAHGSDALAGNRTADFQAGPQVLVDFGHFYATATAGPSTTGVATGVGFTTIAAVGGSAF